MRQSALFTKTRKEAPKDEVSKNAKLLIRAGFIHKEMAGVYSYLPLGLRVLNKIADIIRHEMNAIGGQEVLLSALHPIENYEKTGREAIDVLFHTELAGGAHLVLGQSHEEIITPLVKEYVDSYRDLPLAVYQIQNKFRNELRAKSGIFRGREFIMKDLYSFHANEADFDEFYNKTKGAYDQIFESIGLTEVYYTLASGGSFSKYSHEFQVPTEAGEDTIYVCKDCHVAINEEIIEEQTTCPNCAKDKKELTKMRSVEAANIFPLKCKFSDAFDFTYKDEKGEEQQILMGCYGIGLGRAMGIVAEVNSDEKGMVWPHSIAPFALHLVELSGGDEEVKKNAEELYKKLIEAGVEVLYDDRDVRAGEKFADSDLIGIPYRAIVSKKTAPENKVELVERASGTAQVIPQEDLFGMWS